MSRLGLPQDELNHTCRQKPTRASRILRIVLVMSHLACADDPAQRR